MAQDVSAMLNEQAQASNDEWGQSEASSGCCGGAAASGHGCGCHGPSTTQFGNDSWEAQLTGAINGLRPLFQAKGGDLELIAIEDKSAVVRFSGGGFRDEAALEQVRSYVKMELANAVPGFEELVAVTE